MANFVNHERAAEFLDGISDPIVKNLLLYLYQVLWVSDAVPDCDFDLLYFFRIRSEFLADREGVAKALKGNYEQGSRGLAED